MSAGVPKPDLPQPTEAAKPAEGKQGIAHTVRQRAAHAINQWGVVRSLRSMLDHGQGNDQQQRSEAGPDKAVEEARSSGSTDSVAANEEGGIEDRNSQLTSLLSTLREGYRTPSGIAVQVGNNTVNIGYENLLGSGGTKSVFKVMIEGQAYALCLPNARDGADMTLQKWDLVKSEPQTTQKMRDAGLLVTPMCEMVPVTINGVAFDAMQTVPYDALSYEVRDSKTVHEAFFANGTPKPELGNIFEPDLTPDDLVERMHGIVSDIATLARNGVHLGGTDSMNIAIMKGGQDQVRLYFGDLGTTKISGEPLTEREIQSVVSDALSVLHGVMSLQERQQHAGIFGGTMFSREKTADLSSQLVGQVMQQIAV